MKITEWLLNKSKQKGNGGSGRFRPRKQGPASLSQIEDYFWEPPNQTEPQQSSKAALRSSQELFYLSSLTKSQVAPRSLPDSQAWKRWNDSNKAEGRLNRPSEVQTVSQATAAGRFLRQLISAVHGITTSSPGAKRTLSTPTGRNPTTEI